jgi:hypothetical protein
MKELIKKQQEALDNEDYQLAEEIETILTSKS